MFLESAANSAAFSGVGVGGAGAGTGTGTGAGGDCIQTYVRIRPQEGSPSSAVSVDPSRGLVSTASSSFVFDHVGGKENKCG